MAKKGKASRKRSARRERARSREAGLPADEQASVDETADEAEATAQDAVAPTPPPARDRRAPRARPEEVRENAWTRMTSFLREVTIEARKINWPAREETWRSALVVALAVVFLALFMGAFQFVFGNVAETVFRSPQGIAVQQGPGSVPQSPIGTVDTGAGIPAEDTDGTGTGETEGSGE